MSGSCTYRCGYSSYNACSGDKCDKKRDCLACNGSNVCNVDVGNKWTYCPANYYCSGGTCYSGPCGSSACQSDTCTGSCPGCLWRDYPSSCSRYCDGSGNCQSCSCSYTDRDPDSASSYCTGCGQYWDSTSNKCCGDDGGTTDTWCNTGGGSCVNGTWYSDHCSDGVKNCDEKGVDSGGSCPCNLNQTGNVTIDYTCILDGTHHIVNGNLNIVSGGSLQMNAGSSLIFDSGKQIIISGDGYILMGANAQIIKD